MRVLIVMPLAEQRGGAEVALGQLMREGRGQGVEWSVVFLEDGPMVEAFRQLGIDAHVVPAGRLRQIQRYVRTVASIRALARQRRADLIFGWMTKAHLYGGVAATVAGVPAIWYQHGIPTGKSWMDRLATKLPASGVIATSRSAAAAQSRLWPVRNQRVVYPGVDQERFDPGLVPGQETVRRDLDLPRTGQLIGFFGRLQRWKGAHLLIEAMPRVLETFPDACCVIVGGKHELEPDYPQQLSERIASLRLRGHAILAGFQPDVPRWMRAMNVVVLPSVNEPFGMTVIEAMALSKPVIAGGSGGPAEIITSEVNGLLVPENDSRAVAEAILRYLKHHDFAASVGAAARERGKQFTAQRYARELIRALSELSVAQTSARPLPDTG